MKILLKFGLKIFNKWFLFLINENVVKIWFDNFWETAGGGGVINILPSEQERPELPLPRRWNPVSTPPNFELCTIFPSFFRMPCHFFKAAKGEGVLYLS